MITKEDVARVAERVVAARRAGQQRVRIGQVTFETEQGGWCARFVRQAHEAALGLAEFTWKWRAANAWEMERALAAAGKQTAEPERGEIVGLNRGLGGAPGHIGIYLGEGRVAENTASGARGEPRAPGTKITPLGAVLHRVSGYYATLPAAQQEEEPKVVLLPGSRVLGCRARVEAGVTRVDLRALVEGLGYEVHDRLREQGKVYLRKPGG